MVATVSVMTTYARTVPAPVRVVASAFDVTVLPLYFASAVYPVTCARVAPRVIAAFDLYMRCIVYAELPGSSHSSDPGWA